MKFLLKFTARIAEITIGLCVFAAAALIWLNDKCSEAVNLKLMLGYDAMIFVISSVTGIICEQLLKQYKK